MKVLANKVWQRILAMLLVIVSVFSLTNLPSFARRTVTAEEYTGTFTQCTGMLTSGDYVFGVGTSADSISALNTDTSSNNWIKFTKTTSTSGSITNPDSSIVWFYDATAGTFQNGTNYIAWPTSGNSAFLKDTATPLTVTETSTAGVYNITVTKTSTRELRLNGGSGYRFYANTSTTGTKTFYFFKLVESACEHTNKVAIGEAKAATCTEDGITAGLKCADCDTVITAQEVIPAGHNYVDGACTVCGEKQPTTLTINRGSFGDDASGYAWHTWTATTTKGDTISGSGFIYGTTKASIQMNGEKAGDYIYNTTALPERIISVTITKASGTDRNFDVLTSATPFDSITTASLKGQATEAKKLVTTDGVTWELKTNHKYFAIVICDSSAAYLSSIEIKYGACAHAENVAIGEAKDATCTEDGITAGVKCADCGEIITAQESIPATGHKDENPVDSKCDTCGVTYCTSHVWVDGEVTTAPTCTATGIQAKVCQNCGEPGEDEVLDALGHTEEIDEAVAPTCTATGLTEGSHCSVCKEVIIAQETIEATGHSWDSNNFCTVCGKENPRVGVYKKVTENLDDWSGRYLIVYEAEGRIFNGGLETLDAAHNNETVKLNNGYILTDEKTKGTYFDIAAVEGGYSIKSQSGKYIGGKDGSNKINENVSTAYINTISCIDGQVEIKSDNTYLRYNATDGDNNERFRYYKSESQEPIALYKWVEVDGVYDLMSLSTEASFKLVYNNDKTETTPNTVNTAKLRFTATIGAQVWEKLTANKEWYIGVEVQNAEVVQDCNKGTNWKPARVNENNQVDENGDYYTFSAVISRGTKDEGKWGVVLTARAYVCIDGVKYYLNEVSYSVNTLAQQILTEEADTLTATAKDTLLVLTGVETEGEQV